jgi:hypothetical protein
MSRVKRTQKSDTMGKNKKNLKDLEKSKDLKTLGKVEMKKIVGGKKRNKRGSNGCGNFTPQ